MMRSGAHPKGVDQQVAHGDLTGPFRAHSPSLEAHDVRLLELELGRVLDGDEPLAVGNLPRERVHERRLPRARAPLMRMLSLAFTAIWNISAIAGDSTPRSAMSVRLEPRMTKRRMEMAAPSSASGGMMMLTREPSGRRASTIGARLVDATPDLPRDALRDVHQVLRVAEGERDRLEPALALDVGGVHSLMRMSEISAS